MSACLLSVESRFDCWEIDHSATQARGVGDQVERRQDLGHQAKRQELHCLLSDPVMDELHRTAVRGGEAQRHGGERVESAERFCITAPAGKPARAATQQV
jgi:hypothetical protein